ncbi:MAG: hypothetical protein ACXAD7_16880, partial [Candidatus Kariarchaeaceae archaeon]
MKLRLIFMAVLMITLASTVFGDDKQPNSAVQTDQTTITQSGTDTFSTDYIYTVVVTYNYTDYGP